jgi:hypothetical protein
MTSIVYRIIIDRRIYMFHLPLMMMWYAFCVSQGWAARNLSILGANVVSVADCRLVYSLRLRSPECSKVVCLRTRRYIDCHVRVC